MVEKEIWILDVELTHPEEPEYNNSMDPDIKRLLPGHCQIYAKSQDNPKSKRESILELEEYTY